MKNNTHYTKRPLIYSSELLEPQVERVYPIDYISRENVSQLSNRTYFLQTREIESIKRIAPYTERSRGSWEDIDFTRLRQEKNNLLKNLRNKFSKSHKKQLALLLPGHNEELIIATTIKSALAGGQDKKDIYVVDDNSSDNTRAEAVKLLGEANVLSVERSGKALAVKKALNHFDIVNRYEWLHVADADSVFCPDYFRIYKEKLDSKKYSVALGFVQSLRGNWISDYRAATYTYSQHVNRRIQSKLGMISVFPGPITSFRTDIIDDLDFESNTLTEDFDITLQVHRKKLGKILFIPKAVNYTQDPQTLKDFIKQNQRWQRGFFQGVKKYNIGKSLKAIDLSLSFQVWQAVFYLFQLFVLLPMVIILTGEWMYLAVFLAADFVIASVATIISSIVIKRWSVIGSLPYFYFLRWVEIAVFVASFVEIYWLKKFRGESRGWSTKGRRYKLNSMALKDTAKG